MNDHSIGIVGAGAAGLAIAAEYTLAGHHVIVAELHDFLHALPDEGRIRVRGLTFRYGIERGEYEVRVTTAVNFDALATCRAVIVATTSIAHATVLTRLQKILSPEALIIVMCGNASTLAASGPCAMAETNTMPYGVRRSGEVIHITILTPGMLVAGEDKTTGGRALAVLRAVYPETVLADKTLACALSNPNPMMHPPIVLTNLAEIETGHEFSFYERATPAVRDIIAGIDKERMTIGAACGVRLAAFEDLEGVIQVDAELIPQPFLTCGKYAALPAPTALAHRYVTEDVPYGLALWEQLGIGRGIDTPHITAIVNLLSTALQQDLRTVTAERTHAIVRQTHGDRSRE